MLEAARDATHLVSGKSRNDLDQDRTRSLALMKLIEIIGEAASKVSVNCRKQVPRIPWTVIIAMRNRLIHAYFDIELEILWQTVVEDLPPLIEALEEAISEC